MDKLMALLSRILDVLQDQQVITLLLALLSLLISIAAYRRTAQGVIVTQKNMYVEQSRFLDGQWQSLIQMILARDDFANWVEKTFPDIYGDNVKMTALQYWLANILSTAYQSYRFKLIEDDRFDAHLFSVWLFWGKDSARLMAFLRQGYQSKGFIQQCQEALQRIESRHAAPLVPPNAPQTTQLQP